MPTARVQVRLYAAGGPAIGREIKPKQVLEATWRVSRLSGYAEGFLRLAGLPSEHPGLVNDARIEFWGWDDVQQTYLRLYRGYVLQSVGKGRTPTNPRETQVTLYGFWDRLARQVALQRFLEPSPLDISTFFSSLLARWASPAIVGQTYITDYKTTTTELSALDAYRVPISAVVERLDAAAAHQLVVGCDVDPGTGQNRAYIRPFSSVASLVAALPDPSNHIELMEDGRDARQRANVLHLRGGVALYPNLIAAMTRSQDGSSGTGNSAFQVPRLGGGGYGNLVQNGGFETGDFTDWTEVSGDPAVKDSGDPGGPAYAGSKFLELDNDTGPNDAISQEFTGIVEGGKYTIDYVAKAENAAGTPPVALWSLEWFAGSTSISIDTVTLGGALSPVPSAWTQYQHTLTAPATATKLVLTLETIVASVGFGMNFDEIQVYQSDVLYQEGWETATTAGGIFGVIDWTASTIVSTGGARLPFWGAYSPLVRVAGAAVGAEAILRPRGSTTAAVQGGNAYRLSVWSMSPAGETTTPARALVMQELDKDQQPLGAGDGIKRLQIQGGGVYDDWHEDRFVRVVSQDCRYIRIWIEFQEAGALYIGAVGLRDARAPLGEFIEDEAFQAILRVDDAALGLTAPTVDSIADLGVWPEVTTEEAVYTQSDAQAWGRAALDARAIEQLRPRVIWVGSPTLPGSAAPPWPGQVIKGMGEIGLACLPVPQTIVEIAGEWRLGDGGAMLLRMTASLTTDPETETRIQQRLIRRMRLIGR